MKQLNILLLFILSVLSQSICAQDTPAFVKDSLDAYVMKALKDWKIPGAAVCIVKDGKVVMMKGYGVREAGGRDTVDENTLFMIGSNTKAFTSTALAMLDADGKLSLDDKVQQWLPDFKLYDPWVAKEATIRDLLCHRLGFETFQGDFMYFDSDLSLAEVREKFGRMKPRYSFRSRWGYTNAAFMTAGQVIPKASGKSWADFVRDSIFIPLGMNHSLLSSNDMNAATDRASAHTMIDGEIKKVRYGHLENLAPAGSISSSVNDLSHWVLMQLDHGMYNNKQVVPARAIAQTREPASILGNGGYLYNTGHFVLYGLGWVLQEYSGREIVSHTGGVNGFVTSVTLVPEENLGIIVLTNTDANNFYEALKWEVMDAYFGLPYRNYSGVYLDLQKKDEARSHQWLQAKRDSIARHPKPSLPLNVFTGNYVHNVYGKMNIQMESGKLIARFEHHKGRYAELESLGGNRFLASFNDPLYGVKVWPFLVQGGKVKSVTVTVADFVEFTPYEFIKQ
ncbi:MAG TPA: serine hydrolase [Flavisolibacter sp.]|nr:serine hydrolase [Flavisolibacter sp.]